MYDQDALQDSIHINLKEWRVARTVKQSLKYPKVNESTEILELVTIDDDTYQNVIGYYAQGHWDLHLFRNRN
jgi:hypothetical protein